MTPYFEIKLGKLYHGDCLEIMPELGSVDLVLTSPPYNLGNFKKGTWYGGKGKGKRLEYESHSDDMDEKDYIEWQHEILKQCRLILSKNGAIFYNHKPRVNGGIFDDRKNLIPFPIRQEIIWDRCGMINFSGGFYAPNTERIFIIANKLWKPVHKYLKFGEVWRFPPDKNTKHPAPFPSQLANQVIISASQEGDTVLDPFNGSGTTSTQSEILNRKWIGIEISEKYCEIAAKRIEENLTVMERIERSEKGITKKTGLLF